MMFNLCLILFLIFNFFIIFAGLGSILGELEKVGKTLKEITEFFKAQTEVNNAMVSAYQDILNNTICIYQKLEEINSDLSSSEAAITRKRKTYN